MSGGAVTYARPVAATMHVHLENGEQWEATPEDYARFRLVNRGDAYHAFSSALVRALDLERDKDVTDSCLNPIRYLVEVTVGHGMDPDPDDLMEVRALEETLRRVALSEAGGQS